MYTIPPPQVKVGSFLMRLREMRRQAEAAAQSPQKVSGMSPRLGGETEGECGKRESCHPKNQVSVDRDQVSVTGTRPDGEVHGECGKSESCHPKDSGSAGTPLNSTAST